MSAEPVPITGGEDFYVPAFELRLRGRPAGQDLVHDVIQVTYTDDLDKIDSVELTLNNWDAGKRAFKYGNSQLFDPGVQLDVSLGYHGRLRRMITAEVTSLRPTFPATGQPTLAVTALNLLHRLRTKQQTDVYEKLTDTQMAQRITGPGRLGIELRPGRAEQRRREPIHDYVLQNSQYDIVFLLDRARRAGYDLFVEPGDRAGGSRLYFGPSTDIPRAAYKLVWGHSLVSFQPTLTTANQVAKVVVMGWDRRRKEAINEEITRDQLSTKGVGARGRQKVVEASFDQRVEVIHQPVFSKEQALQLARGVFEKIAKDLVTATGSTVGLPDLRAGSVVQIDGLDDRFKGRYFVTGTTHTLGASGYTTAFRCRREEL